MATMLYYVSAREEDGTFVDDVLTQDEAQVFVKQHRKTLIEYRPFKG